ncbi:N-acetyltransferase [Bacillus sp. MUM 116]|uniref:GNAT family N-acetyltransferase n=1 Tax=Bacillus sp. MUM 116 TaxID=1678002 RepID=UPI000A930310|nr:GNAT family N-acetyltransferase [Bacillus sp. MUM 116]
MKSVALEPVGQEKRILYFDYLILADESEEAVKEYIYDGEMFVICWDGIPVGVTLFIFHANDMVELKNIAIVEEFRGSGIGKQVVMEAIKKYRSKGMKKMLVGTANSSIANIAFYQKVGFRMVEIKKDFFKKYPTPIYENGIRALDMVMFEKDLSCIKKID